ncbi:ABC transporter ATP-binding protein [Prauserella cavernicola]|uniref:Sn-glycerol-3-phosphate ABC transporter ATP-binding protein UgpC n=1 Tax=Prauserella cavernicola TaxID=2800127 RepID=A0A934V7T4_9PSEU|nr:sn-glycerol-3-phosphate ABC transporter ATP-binding protein UgpC [Prauserella cavernicola]MBK1788922.1 sn-glycerol-3-phosphate ABC transporter ATP-binding protein UgpC [Prauserella cavernicola]
MAEIVLDKVTKRYPDGALAVSEMEIEIADGEFVILVGPSGCGKSTALNMIAGLEDISSGELRIDGSRANEKAPKDRDIAMVFQSYALYPHMSVRENMAFPLRLAKVADATVRSKVEEAAEILDLTQHLDRKPSNLSGGQRQRVAMGRAIVRSPKAFLMDEPLSNLDAKLRGQMRTSVSKLQRQLGTTTVYVTHDQTEAMTLGDRVVVLRGGIVQQIGSPQFLYDHPANLFVAGFIGSPSMNFVPATLEDGTLKSPLGTIPLTDRVRRLAEAADAPREVVAGIRPEHFEDAALLDDAHRHGGVSFSATVDVLESMGAEKYAYFSLEEDLATTAELEELAADAGAGDVPGGGSAVVARLAASSEAREGSPLDVWFDPDRIQLFDPAKGTNLTYSA